MAQQGYDRNDFLNMQREAERRVIEMQRRAKSRVEAPPEPQPASSAPPPQPKAAPVPAKRNFLEMLNLKSIFESKDTSLILMVLALINSEESDPLMMLALLYIMM